MKTKKRGELTFTALERSTTSVARIVESDAKVKGFSVAVTYKAEVFDESAAKSTVCKMRNIIICSWI
jgi:hypothetical protein